MSDILTDCPVKFRSPDDEFLFRLFLVVSVLVRDTNKTLMPELEYALEEWYKAKTASGMIK